MNSIIILLLTVVIATIESIVRLNFGIYSIQISLVLILSSALYFANHKKNASIILLVGSIMLDIFSPYRFGLYLLFAVISLLLIKFINTKALDINHPVVNFGVYILLVSVYNIFQVASDPVISIYLAVILLNAIIGTIISMIFINVLKKGDKKIEVSENVNIR